MVYHPVNFRRCEGRIGHAGSLGLVFVMTPAQEAAATSARKFVAMSYQRILFPAGLFCSQPLSATIFLSI